MVIAVRRMCSQPPTVGVAARRGRARAPQVQVQVEGEDAAVANVLEWLRQELPAMSNMLQAARNAPRSMLDAAASAAAAVTLAAANAAVGGQGIRERPNMRLMRFEGGILPGKELRRVQTGAKAGGRFVPQAISIEEPEAASKPSKKSRKKRQAEHDVVASSALLPTWLLRFREVERFSALLRTVHEAIQDLNEANQGLAPLSPELSDLREDLLLARTPMSWRVKAGFAAGGRGALASWAKQFELAVMGIKAWEASGVDPSCFRLQLLWSPRSLLTALLQKAARQQGCSLVELRFHYEVKSQFVEASDTQEPAKEGAYVHGLQLQGAGWHGQRCCLAEPKINEQFHAMPVIHFLPMRIASSTVEGAAASSGDVLCRLPLYRTTSRSAECTAGTWQRSSPGFVANLWFKSGDRTAEAWHLAGVVMVLEFEE